LERGGDTVNKFRLVRIAALAFLDEKLSSLHARFEAYISLTAKERFVAITFADFHVLMNTIFARDQRLSWSGSITETGAHASQGITVLL